MGQFADPAASVLGGEDRNQMQPIAVQYTNILHTLRKGVLAPEMERELRTLATAMDCLTQGNMASVGDVLMQRYRSLESRANFGSDHLGKHLELIPHTEASAAGQAELELAAGLELKELKLRELLLKQKVGHPG